MEHAQCGCQTLIPDSTLSSLTSKERLSCQVSGLVSWSLEIPFRLGFWWLYRFFLKGVLALYLTGYPVVGSFCVT